MKYPVFSYYMQNGLLVVVYDVPHNVSQLVLSNQNIPDWMRDRLSRIEPIPPSYRGSACDALEVLRCGDFQYAFETAKSTYSQLGAISSFYLTPSAVERYEKLFWSGTGRLPETEGYQKLKDGLAVGQMAALGSSDKLSALIATATTGEYLYNNVGAIYEEGWDRWKNRALLYQFDNAGVYSSQGYYALALKKTHQHQHHNAKIVILQTKIRKCFADAYENKTAVPNDVDTYLNDLELITNEKLHGQGKEELLAWIGWHRAIINFEKQNISACFRELKKIAKGKSFYRGEAARYLANYHLRRKEYLQANDWLELANKYESDISKSEMNSFLRYLSDVAENNKKEEQAKRQQEIRVDHEPTTLGAIASVTGLALYGSAKILQYVPPLILDGFYQEFTRDFRLGEKNRKKQYEAKIKSILGPITLPVIKGEYDDPVDVSDKQRDLQSVLLYINDTTWFREPSEYINDALQSPLLSFVQELASLRDLVMANNLPRQSDHQRLKQKIDTLPKELQKHFGDEVLFVCFDEFLKTTRTNQMQLLKLINLLGSLVPQDNKKVRNCLQILKDFPSINQFNPNGLLWLLKQMLLPNFDKLNKSNICYALKIALNNNDITKDTIKIHLEDYARNSLSTNKSDKFVLGLGCVLLGIVSTNNQSYYFDLAISRFNMGLPIKHLCFIFTVDANGDENKINSRWNLINLLFEQYNINRRKFGTRLTLLKSLQTKDTTLDENVRLIFRNLFECQKSTDELKKNLGKDFIDIEKIKYWLAEGADVNCFREQTTTTRKDNLYYLYNEITTKRWKIESPLHYAIRTQNIDLTRIFLEYGANMYAKNIYGLEPLQLLMRLLHETPNHKSIEVIGLFRQFGFKKEDVSLIDYINQPAARVPRNLKQSSKATEDMCNRCNFGHVAISEEVRKQLRATFVVDDLEQNFRQLRI